MDTVELVYFTLFYGSDHTQKIIGLDKNYNEKLDYILSQHVQNMTAEEFSTVCRSLMNLN